MAGSDEGASIRPLGLDEGSAFRALRLRALREAPDAYGTLYEDAAKVSDEAWEARYGRAAADENQQLFVAGPRAGSPGGLIGCARVSLDAERQGRAYITSMWVNPEQRRSGVARRLLEACEQWARGRGCDEMQLAVTETNDAARRLYEQSGYRMTGETEPLRAGSPLRSDFMAKHLAAG